jgi:hypothetical protein
MKKVISALTAATMVASMSASVMSAFAVYSANDIAFTMKVNPNSYYDVDGENLTKTAQSAKFTVSDDGKTITFASAADAAGAKIGIDAYIVADTSAPSVQSVGGLVEVDGKNVHLQKAGAELKKAVSGDAEASYTAKAGDFTADRFVSTFGYVETDRKTKALKYGDSTSSMTYCHSTEWAWADTYTGPEVLTWIWMYNLTPKGESTKESAAFLGAKSDDFPVTEFTVELDKNIVDGTYTVNYGESFEHAQYGTTIQSFVNVGTSEPVVPAKMEGITIVVGSGEVTPTEKETEKETEKATEKETEKATEKETEKATEKETQPASHDGFEWDIDDVEYTFEDLASDQIDLGVKVYNDKGSFGFQFQLLIDGKAADEEGFPFEIYEVSDGGAYSKMSIQPNLENGFVAAQFSGDSDDVAKSGENAVVFSLIPKEGVEYTPGTVYKVTFASGAKFANFAKETYKDVTLTAGSITIPGGETPTEATEQTEETEKETEKETQKETEKETQKETEKTSEESQAPAGDLLYGDVNQNKKVELVDIVMLNRYLTGYDNQTLNETQMEVANCAGNSTKGTVDTKKGDLTGADSIEILKYLIGLVASLPTA